MIINRVLASLFLFASLLVGQSPDHLADKSKIVATPHNLLGQRGIANSDTLVQDFTMCRLCHTPSMMAPEEPLWYRKEAVSDFPVEKQVAKDDHEYFPADVVSRSCLSCHDGGIALGFPKHHDADKSQVSLLNKGNAEIPNLNLHLFKFPTGDSETRLPQNDSLLRVEEDDEISCVTCHDPHNNESGHFLRIKSEKSQICFECHEMQNWDLSAHGNPMDPKFSDLKDLACAQCHNIHAVPAQNNLLISDENTLCLNCHDASKDSNTEVASEHDLEEVFEKTFIHPIRMNTSSQSRTKMDSWSSGIAEDRTVACSDCHNPHASSALSHNPFLDGSQLYVEGVDNRGFPKPNADYEYETCYKCHGLNQNADFGGQIAALFSRSNKSFHPIEAPGNNPNVPSLKAEWSEQSMIQCSDCHGNDDPMGAQGPHGSNVAHILKASYSDYPFASVEENQLCFKCHEEQRVVQSNGFKYHRLHIVEAGYACSSCHDPHGSIENPGLFDLNANFIKPVNGVLEIVQTEPGHGSCTMSCHDKAHIAKTY